MAVLLTCTVRAALAQVMALTDRSFDQALREYPVAMVAFVTPWCGRYCTALGPVLERLASTFAETGVAIARASAEASRELLERFDVVSYPTLIWFDAASKWPHYASDATPERYAGERSHDALVAFIEKRVGFSAPQRAPPPPSPIPPRVPEPPTTWTRNPATAKRAAGHVCTDASSAYTSCMRHRLDRQHMCESERNEYLLCMSGQWVVHPDDHKHLAAKYADFVGQTTVGTAHDREYRRARDDDEDRRVRRR